MKLLLDLGNTRLKWAWLDGARLRDAGAAVHAGCADAVAAIDPVATPSEVMLSSVASPALTVAVVARVEARWPVRVRLAGTEARGGGVVNGYREPAQMGVDRWLSMVAAWNRHRGALCIADAGTALTIDMVAADGRHAGGLILPGRALMQRALLADTGRIAASAERLIDPRPAAVPGRDTRSCLEAGARLSHASVVERCLQLWPGRLAVTGGDAAVLLADLSVPADHRPLLVLEGLALRLGGIPAVECGG